jgi:predicted DNA-binding antitoxin AbrB/MazE fold protein
MTQIEAIFRHGVFEPLEPVQLREEQRVRLNIEPAGDADALKAFERLKAMREKIRQREGIFPDSAPEIAADRMR